ncbi:MAG: Tfp pilus assembly protein FimT/FimU [Candidatus Nealsonbacteria bacterium]
MQCQIQNKLGFSLVELLIIIGIVIIAASLVIPSFSVFRKESGLINNAEEIINILRLAQNKTLASEKDSQWGVYFSTSTLPHQYTFFKGSSYESRDVSVDKVYALSQGVEFYEIDFLGETELVFDRIVGTTSQSGKISLRLKEDVSKDKQIFVQSSGQITSTQGITPADTNRIKDSRHVHFDYNRHIETSTETLKLIFSHNSSTITRDIIIIDNMKEGQIYWEGQVDVGGESQKLKIHTHRLNSPDTQFCIHRDRRYNTKALKVEISGDTTGDLISYDVEGQTTKGTSIYVSEPIQQ